jgi:hypothetical protein
MKLNSIIAVLVSLFSCCALAPVALAQVTIAANSKSTFTIVISSDAPTSVQDAATELQKDIQIATGAKLNLQKDTVKIATPIISLSSTAQAKTAGITTENLSDEAFRIVTKNGNLYIIGIDTPDGGWTKNDGASNGTANGVYTFLEDYLDVRWLMPGDLGRDVPAKSTFTIGDIDRTVTPQFSWRRVTHLWDYSNAMQLRSIMQWDDHQKLGGATQLDYDHNWWRAVNDNKGNDVNTPAVKALYAAHPDWFAMDASGKRPYPESHYSKFETTNQELVHWFAEKAIAALKASDRPRTFSLSPSDGGGRWSKSPESVALYDPSPSQLTDSEAPAGEPGMSSLVLKWYHDVAQIVAKEYPQGRLAGYIYSSYVFPPTKISMKLPDNFTPVICGIGTYGYGLYRPENQKQWKYVMDSWAKVAPQNWYYYDLPNQLLRQLQPEIGEANFPGSTGSITPAAPDILNTVFHQLVKSRIKGSYIYGVPSWSNGALGNYLLAKMEWDPTQNAEDLQREWLNRAYGTDAGKVMEQFYTELNGWFRDYYEQHSDLSYKLTLGMMKDIYAARYPEMEKLLLQAKSQPMTEIQQQRLQLLENNLIVMQWRLRNAGFLPASFTSPLQRNDAQVNALLTADNADFPLFPGAIKSDVASWNRPQPLSYKVQLDSVAKADDTKSTFTGLDDNEFLIYAAKSGEIRITPKMVASGAYFPSYELTNQLGQTVSSGILNTAVPIMISAKAGDIYILKIPSRKAVNYQLQVENAAVADASFADKTLTLSGKTAPVYVLYIPRAAPVGVMEDENSVLIKKPYSGAMASKIMGVNYSDVRVLNTFEENLRFKTDPQNELLQKGVTNADFDDSDWKTISSLDWWQMQGYPDYHGVAWYRVKFTAKPLKKGERARLYFGAVDGNTVVYLNGKKLTEHILGENYKGWDSPFSSSVTSAMQPGENTLVVKVTSKNNTTASGIFKGIAIVAGTPIQP